MLPKQSWCAENQNPLRCWNHISVFQLKTGLIDGDQWTALSVFWQGAWEMRDMWFNLFMFFSQEFRHYVFLSSSFFSFCAVQNRTNNGDRSMRCIKWNLAPAGLGLKRTFSGRRRRRGWKGLEAKMMKRCTPEAARLGSWKRNRTQLVFLIQSMVHGLVWNRNIWYIDS